RRVHQVARAHELLVQVMVAQHVADVLAEEALDALPELLDPVHVLLLHPPGAVGRVGRARGERADLPLDPEVPAHVGDQVLVVRKGAHRLDGDRLRQVEVAQPAHAHELRPPVDLGGAGAALACLAVPADGEVGRLLGLDLVHGVQHYHPLRGLGGVVGVRPLPTGAAPDAEGRLRHHFISSMIRLRSSRIGGMATLWSSMAPARLRSRARLTQPCSALLPGKSSRKWPPRLSFRASAEVTIASETVSRWRRSSAVCQPGLYSRFPVTPTRPARARSLTRPSAARASSDSRRTMPASSCIISWRSCCTA